MISEQQGQASAIACDRCGGFGWTWIPRTDDAAALPRILRCGRCCVFRSDAHAAHFVVELARMSQALRQQRAQSPQDLAQQARLWAHSPRLLKAAIAARDKLNVLLQLAGDEDPDWRELDAAIREAHDEGVQHG